MNIRAIAFATNSARSMDAKHGTGYFSSMHSSCPGKKTHAPRGPGLPLQDPSVKMNDVATSLPSIAASMISLRADYHASL